MEVLIVSGSCVIKRTGVLRALAEAFIDAADCLRLGSCERTDVVRHVPLWTIEVQCLDGFGPNQGIILSSLLRLERLSIASILILF